MAFALFTALLVMGGTSCRTIQRVPTGTGWVQAGPPVRVYSQSPWNPTGVRLVKGDRYFITGRIVGGKPYRDSFIRCTPDGPVGIAGWVEDHFFRDLTDHETRYWFLQRVVHVDFGKEHRLRVLQDADGHRASFLTLIAATGKNDSEEQVHVIGSANEFTARRSGELYLFVNDWPGGSGECPLWDGNGNMVSETYLNNSGLLEATVWRCPRLSSL